MRGRSIVASNPPLMKRLTMLLGLAIIAISTPARASDTSTVDTLHRLIQSYGVSGFEGPVRGAVSSMLPAWAHPKTDAMGNLILQVGSGSPSLLFIAHMD